MHPQGAARKYVYAVVTVIHESTNHYLVTTTDTAQLYEKSFKARLRCGRGKKEMAKLWKVDPRLSFSYTYGDSLEEVHDIARQQLINLNEDPLCLNRDTGYSNYACYTLTHQPTGQHYVGYGRDFTTKRRIVREILDHREFPHKAFQKLWSKDGKAAFRWHIHAGKSMKEIIAKHDELVQDKLCLNEEHVVDEISKGTFIPKYRTETIAKKMSKILQQDDQQRRIKKQFSKPVRVEGVNYPSASDAARELNIPIGTIFAYLRSKDPRWKRFYFLFDKEKIALDDGKAFDPSDYPDIYLTSKKEPVVYMLRYLPTGRVYIGETADFATRRGQHVNCLIKDKHHCPTLQAQWNLDSDVSHWQWEWIDAPSKEDAIQMEWDHIRQYRKKAFNSGGSFQTPCKSPAKLDGDVIHKRAFTVGFTDLSHSVARRKFHPDVSKHIRRPTGSRSFRSIKLDINGYRYDSIKEASQLLKMDPRIIMRRIKDDSDPQWNGWKLVDKERWNELTKSQRNGTFGKARRGGKNPAARKVSVNGKVFPTMLAASRYLGRNPRVVRKGVKESDPRWDHVKYVD